MNHTASRLLGLVALTGVAALAGWSVGHVSTPDQQQPVGKVTGTAAKPPVEVRTEVIHKTVHVRRKRHHRRAASRPSVPATAPRRGAASRDSGAHSGRRCAAAAGVAQRSAAPAGLAPAPVRTRTSGAGGGAGGEREDHGESEHESEGGDD